jgi:hypothetical protein
MKRSEKYIDLDGGQFSLADLDVEERRLVERLRRRAAQKPDWDDFDNYAYKAVGDFYDARGLSRKEALKTVPFKIIQDLSGRLGIAQGMIRPDDYRDELADLIGKHFPSRNAFCKASGISPDMLSHVLAGRKDLSLEALSKGLERIGYRLRIVPATAAKRTG